MPYQIVCGSKTALADKILQETLLVELALSHSSRWKHWEKIRCYMFDFKLKIHTNVNIYILTARRNLKIRAHTSVDAMTQRWNPALQFDFQMSKKHEMLMANTLLIHAVRWSHSINTSKHSLDVYSQPQKHCTWNTVISEYCQILVNCKSKKGNIISRVIFVLIPIL